jgi:hypothetical protein
MGGCAESHMDVRLTARLQHPVHVVDLAGNSAVLLLFAPSLPDSVWGAGEQYLKVACQSLF